MEVTKVEVTEEAVQKMAAVLRAAPDGTIIEIKYGDVTLGYVEKKCAIDRADHEKDDTEASCQE